MRPVLAETLRQNRSVQFRKAAAACLTAKVAASTSARAVSLPDENRIICREGADLGFIALMTCDGSSESARHAEPDEAQTPA